MINITTQKPINNTHQNTPLRHFNPHSVSLPTSISTTITAALALLPELIRSFEMLNERHTITGDKDHNTLRGTQQDDVILGKSGEDLLIGGKGNDFIKGGAGENELRGGKGHDFLLGGSEYDELKGGDGNDLLYSGDGDDDLFGGKGTNQLFGGKGDDYLENNQGLSDGGKGFDIAAIKGSYKDYMLIIPKNVTADDTMLLKNKLSGETLLVKNIEEFEFSDDYFSRTELIQAIGVEAPETPPSQPTVPVAVSVLSLTPAQTTALKNLTKFSTFQVNDNDLSGTLSKGDDVISSSGTTVKLTADHVASIEKHVVSIDKQLTLSQQQKDNITKGITNLKGENVSISDEDGSGNISAGDILTIPPIPHAFGSLKIKKTLTEDNVKQINGEYGQPLKQSAVNLSILIDALELNKTKKEISLVLDHDGSGTLNVGDKVLINPKKTNFNPFAVVFPLFPDYHTLTEKDLIKINNLLVDKPSLELTAGQKDKVKVLTGFNNFRVEDNDLSKGLSEGDRVISTTGKRFKLTTTQVSLIEKALTLSQQQKNNITTGSERLNGENVTISDEDGSGEVSAGDILSSKYSLNGGSFAELDVNGRAKIVTFNQTLTEDHANHINGVYGTPLENAPIGLLGNLLNIHGSFQHPKLVLDHDGSGDISVGDKVVLGGERSPFSLHRPSFPNGYRTLTQENIDALKVSVKP